MQNDQNRKDRIGNEQKERKKEKERRKEKRRAEEKAESRVRNGGKIIAAIIIKMEAGPVHSNHTLRENEQGINDLQEIGSG